MAVYLALLSSSLAVIIFFLWPCVFATVSTPVPPSRWFILLSPMPRERTGQGQARCAELGRIRHSTGPEVRRTPFFTGSALPVQVGRHRRKPPKARYRVEGTHWDQDLERMFSQAGKVPWLPGWSVARMRPGAQGSCSRTLGFPPTLRDLKSPATVCLCDLVRKGMDVSVWRQHVTLCLEQEETSVLCCDYICVYNSELGPSDTVDMFVARMWPSKLWNVYLTCVYVSGYVVVYDLRLFWCCVCGFFLSWYNRSMW